MSKPRDLELNFKRQAIKDTLVNFFVPLIALTISLAVGFLVLYPSYKALPLLKAELEQKSTLEQNLDRKLNNLNGLVDFKRAVDENSELVNTVLVSEELVPALLTQIDKIVRASGMEITKLNYSFGGGGSTTKPEDYNTVSVNLNATGTFQQLVSLLKTFENTARMINVDVARYSRTVDEEKGEVVAATFVLSAPYLFVESTAVTDEPLELDISSAEFIKLINKIKEFQYFDPYEIDADVPVILVEEEDAVEGNAADLGIFGGTPESAPEETTEASSEVVEPTPGATTDTETNVPAL